MLILACLSLLSASLAATPSLESKVYLHAVALNEEPYIDEWIEFHLKIGVDKVFIYDNSDTFRLEDLPARYKSGRITVRHQPGYHQQLIAAADMTIKHGEDDAWVLFFDVDEFLVLRRHENIKSFLMDVSPQGGSLSIHWAYFGPGGEITYRPAPVLERFLWRLNTTSETVKNIAYLPHVQSDKFSSPHFPTMIPPHTQHDCHGNVFTGLDGPHPTEDIAVIHHYYSKSIDEYLAKIKRGNGRSRTNVNHRIGNAHRMSDAKWDDSALRQWREKSPVY